MYLISQENCVEDVLRLENWNKQLKAFAIVEQKVE